jgi:uncharacterized membrane protein YcaP (DUF421 family)
MGKREIGQLQPFELVITILIADLAAVPMQEVGIPLLQGIIPILGLFLAQLVFSFINLKSRKAREIVCGTPSILIQKGKIIDIKLRKQKYTINELLEQLRTSGYPNIEDVEYAILETSGEISVIPKPDKMPVTMGDLKLNSQYKGLPRPLVVDGKYLEDNIKDMGYEKNWINKKLKENNLTLPETLVLISDELGNVFCQKKEGT